MGCRSSARKGDFQTSEADYPSCSWYQNTEHHGPIAISSSYISIVTEEKQEELFPSKKREGGKREVCAWVIREAPRMSGWM
jgi:hypothetical protein